MTEIVLCRVDSRLIHGQVMTKWVQQSKASKIIIISNTVAKDTFLLDIYKMSAPPGIDILCYTEEEAVDKWQKQQFPTAKILLLFADIRTLATVYLGGLTIDSVQIGGLGGGPKRKVVYQNITLDNADLSQLVELNQAGLVVFFQTIPEDTPLTLEAAVKKMGK